MTTAINVDDWQFVVVFRESGDHSRMPMVVERTGEYGIVVGHISDLDFSYIAKKVGDKYHSTAFDIYALPADKKYVDWTTEFNQRNYTNAKLIMCFSFQPTNSNERYGEVTHRGGHIKFRQQKLAELPVDDIFIDSLNIIFEPNYLISKLAN